MSLTFDTKNKSPQFPMKLTENNYIFFSRFEVHFRKTKERTKHDFLSQLSSSKKRIFFSIIRHDFKLEKIQGKKTPVELNRVK